MTQRLAGKTAFVTAAGQGIGRAVAVAFAREGAHVIASDIQTAALESLAREAGCTTLRLDVSDGAAIVAAAAAQGPVDVLFNCAGFVHHGSVLDCTEDEWSFAFDLNVRMRRTHARNAIAAMPRGPTRLAATAYAWFHFRQIDAWRRRHGL